MEKIVVAILLILAIVLVIVALRRRSFTEPIGTIANIATIVSFLIAIVLLFLQSSAEEVPTPTPSETEFPSTQTSELTATLESPTSTPDPTKTPTSTPTATPSPTITPSHTPAPPSPTSLPASSTPRCAPVTGAFATTWSQLQDKIGCARSAAISGLVVEENFQYGKMFWREPIDYAQALVLFGNGTNGTWNIYEHAPYIEGSPEYPCADANTPPQTPPTPKRGFGTMWCDIPEIRSGLGNATDAERGYSGFMQEFDSGFMIQTDYGANYVFYSNNVWEKK